MIRARRTIALTVLLVAAQFIMAQSIADVDTFIVEDRTFVSTTPTDWFSTYVADGIKQDTTWNYKMQYAPKKNPENTRAEIWIHVVNNSNQQATKKQQREFRKNCTVVQTKLGGWGSYLLNYKGEKIKGCRECDMIYTQVYIVPLNDKQSLEILFFGQGKWPQVYELEIAFGQIASTFVKTNNFALCRFRIVDFSKPYTTDSFIVGEFLLRAPVPYGFTKAMVRNSSAGSIHSLSLPREDAYFIEQSSGGLQIYVTGLEQTFSDSEIVQLPTSDTTVSITNIPSANGYGYSRRMHTARQIIADSNKALLINFYIEVGYLDDAWTEYLEVVLRDYANKFMLENSAPKKNGIKKLQPVHPNPTLKPLELEIQIGPEKTNKLEKGLPKPKNN